MIGLCETNASLPNFSVQLMVCRCTYSRFCGLTYKHLFSNSGTHLKKKKCILLRTENTVFFFSYSGSRNTAGELREGVHTDNRLHLFDRKCLVGDTAAPVRQALLLAVLKFTLSRIKYILDV